MESMGKTFSLFINYALRILFLVPLFSPVRYLYRFGEFPVGPSVLFLILTLGVFWGARVWLKKGQSPRKLFGGILLLAIVLRVLCFLNIQSIPFSDFSVMYDTGRDLFAGDYDMFWGTHYFARFPHMTPTVIYFGLIQTLFDNPLEWVRLLNMGYSILNVVLIYKLACEIFKNQNGSLYTMLLAALYPPMIYFSNVFASENLAMPLLLLSVLAFFKALRQGYRWFIISGLFLGMTHLFRPVGYVVLIAYLMYCLIYYRGPMKKRMLSWLSILGPSLFVYVSIALLFLFGGVTQYPLWHGMEPISASILKGTNIESIGHWNEEDAAVFHEFNGDYQKVDEEQKRRIKERLTQTPKAELLNFYILKYSVLWATGDFDGTYWSEVGLEDPDCRQEYAPNLPAEESGMIFKMSSEGLFYSQVFYFSVLLLVYIGLLRNPHGNRKMNLFYIMFCGFALQGLILEAQVRYSYMASWLFIFLVAMGFSSEKEGWNAE